MRKLFTSVMSVTVLVLIASGVAAAQTQPYNSAPAQPQPGQPSQTTPAQTPPSQTAPAQNGPGQVSPGQVPVVSNLKPFSAEADFMSLPGYLRYLMHQVTGQWFTYAEAGRVVRQQGAQ